MTEYLAEIYLYTGLTPVDINRREYALLKNHYKKGTEAIVAAAELFPDYFVAPPCNSEE
jgi:hypothetical protein